MTTMRKLAAATALFALLLFSCDVGEACEVWQYHHCDTSTNCPICHLGHQALEPAAMGQPLAAPERLDSLPVPQFLPFVPGSLSENVGSRAPPAA